MEVDYRIVLQDLRQRRARLDSAIAAIQELLGVVAAEPQSQPAATVEGGTFLDTAVAMLRATGRPLATPELAGLVEATPGFASSSKNLASTLFTLLKRDSERPNARVVKEGKLWGLPEWDASAFKRAARSDVSHSPGGAFAPKGKMGMSTALVEILSNKPMAEVTSTALLEQAVAKGVVTTSTNPIVVVEGALLKLRRKGCPQIELTRAHTYRWNPQRAAVH